MKANTRPKFAFILSGCGYLDGSEINEVVLSILHCQRKGADIHFFAPDQDQSVCTNHLNGEQKTETRNSLEEAARIVRGNVKKIEDLDSTLYEALVLPGGFGQAQTLSDFAFKGEQMSVNSKVESIIKEFYNKKKPIAALCISPVIIAKVLGEVCSPELTIGDNKEVAGAIESMGAKHITCCVDQAHIDLSNKIISTPAYMFEEKVSEVDKGIYALVEAIFEIL